MRRVLCCCAGLLVLGLAGCSRAGAYRSVVRDQTAALEEMAAILQTVTDAASMEAARDKLQDRYSAFEAIVRRAKALGRPAPDISDQLREDVARMNAAYARRETEKRRVRSLPGGDAFLKALED